MHWSVVMFGKYKGKSLPEIVFHDPGYFFWAVDVGAFRGRGTLEREAELIAGRARRIRVPSDHAGAATVAYVYSRFDGRFSHLTLAAEDNPYMNGDSLVLRRDVIDLGLIFQTKPNFKLDGMALISSVKSIVFGNARYRMTRQRCEAFFSRHDNFVT